MAPRITLGSSVVMGKDVWLNIIRESSRDIHIIIEDNCLLSERTWLSAKNSIHLERDVEIGPSVLIMDHGHAYENIDMAIRKQAATPGGSVRIGQGCRIGAGAAVLSTRGELTLGQHSVVTPGSVVLRSAPPYSVLSGNPARLVKTLDAS